MSDNFSSNCEPQMGRQAHFNCPFLVSQVFILFGILDGIIQTNIFWYLNSFDGPIGQACSHSCGSCWFYWSSHSVSSNVQVVLQYSCCSSSCEKVSPCLHTLAVGTQQLLLRRIGISCMAACVSLKNLQQESQKIEDHAIFFRRATAFVGLGLLWELFTCRGFCFSMHFASNGLCWSEDFA